MAHMRATQWLFLLLPVFAQGYCGSRRSKPQQARIVGGSEAPINSWPWQAMLRQKDGKQFCGGTLIDPSLVLTAAHCLSGETQSSFFVRLGAHYKENDTLGTEQDIDVVQNIVHENFSTPLEGSNDIALLKLARPVNLTEAIGVACLPDSTNSLVNKTCWITGWGKLYFGRNQSSDLIQASVPLVSHQRCRQAHPGLVDDSMMCAGPEQGGVDTCQGDSGGPLVCEFNDKWYLEGVASWGHDGCGDPGKFGVYAKVRVFMSWINVYIKSSSASTAAACVETSTPTAPSAMPMCSASSLKPTNQTSSAYSPPPSINATIQQTPSSVHGTSPVPGNPTNPTTEGKAEDEGKGEASGDLNKLEKSLIGVVSVVSLIAAIVTCIYCCCLKKSKITVEPSAGEHRLERIRGGNPESVSQWPGDNQPDITEEVLSV